MKGGARAQPALQGKTEKGPNETLKHICCASRFCLAFFLILRMSAYSVVISLRQKAHAFQHSQSFLLSHCIFPHTFPFRIQAKLSYLIRDCVPALLHRNIHARKQGIALLHVVIQLILIVDRDVPRAFFEWES